MPRRSGIALPEWAAQGKKVLAKYEFDDLWYLATVGTLLGHVVGADDSLRIEVYWESEPTKSFVVLDDLHPFDDAQALPDELTISTPVLARFGLHDWHPGSVHQSGDDMDAVAILWDAEFSISLVEKKDLVARMCRQMPAHRIVGDDVALGTDPCDRHLIERPTTAFANPKNELRSLCVSSYSTSSCTGLVTFESESSPCTDIARVCARTDPYFGITRSYGFLSASECDSFQYICHPCRAKLVDANGVTPHLLSKHHKRPTLRQYSLNEWIDYNRKKHFYTEDLSMAAVSPQPPVVPEDQMLELHLQQLHQMYCAFLSRPERRSEFRRLVQQHMQELESRLVDSSSSVIGVDIPWQ